MLIKNWIYIFISDVSIILLLLKEVFLQIFGEHLFLAGFPPWLVRHSEIYLAKDLNSSEANIIEQALQKYLRTKQRFGA